ncbi:hypothetical protein VPNG_05102 [Cytospora leucostoma]|uniref:BHLH domain-containing protein n=1 Tax=Cytospora leucostoma TaxID=1230097 RepID=A0A423X4B2_9PEZI|nr:hypothetical protein VPNG_05102 [Cytospora leucostoma]
MPSSTSPAAAAEEGRESRATSQPQRKKRVRHFTEDDRAAHRAFEKERREAFRDRLLAMAELLPSLRDRNPQALSKHIVVEEGITHITALNARLDEAAQQMHAIVKERDEILGELNRWRSQAGIAPRQPSDRNADPLQQGDHGESSRIGPSPARHPVGVDSPFEPSPEASDLAFQVNMPHAFLGDNAIPDPDPFDTVNPPLPVSFVGPSRMAPDPPVSLGMSKIGADIQTHADSDPFNNEFTADMFDANFVLDALQPTTSDGPADHQSTNGLTLDFIPDMQTYTGNYIV